jgi:hypothetical protein
MTERDAFDREIASRLDSASTHPDGDALLRLSEATSRGRRIRRWRRRVAGAAAVLAVVAVPAVTVVTLRAVSHDRPVTVAPADPTRLLGTFTTGVTSGRTGDTSVDGRWTLTLHGDGTIGVTAPSRYHGVVSGSDFKAAGDTVSLNLFVQDLCSSAPVGRYRWTRDDAGLHFRVLTDGCAARRLVLTSAVWRPGI